MNKELLIFIQKSLILIGIALLAYGVYVSKEIFFVLAISGFLTIIIGPLADRGERYNIPGWMTVLSVFLLLAFLVFVVIGTLVPILVNYISDTITTVTLWANTAKETYMTSGIQGFHLHPYIERGVLLLFGAENIDHTLDIVKQNAGSIQTFLSSQVSSLTSSSISIVSAVGGTITTWLLIAISTFLMILERSSIGRYIRESVPLSIRPNVEHSYEKTHHVFSAWIRAMLILSVSIFAVTYIGLTLVEWIFDISLGKTFTLALISGIMEFIPYVGPLIALIPAAILALGISWKAAAIIVILYLIIQRIENDFLVPYVMSRALDLSPFFVFIVMLFGAALGGVIGIILALPIAGVVSMIMDEYRTSEKNKMPLAKRMPAKKVAKNLTPIKKSISSK